MLEVMPESIDDLLLTAQLISADGAVDDFVIRTGYGAVCRYFVLANGLIFGMAECFAVLSAADFAFCRFGACCSAASVICFVVDLVAAGAFMPMQSTVRRPFVRPIMAERRTVICSRVGNIAAIALRGLRAVLGTRCVIVRDIAREAVPESIDDLLFTAQLISAYGTVDDFVIRACFGADCGDFILTDGLAFGMAERRAVLHAADLALCKSNARRGAAAMVCLVVDLVAAAAFMPMRGTVRRPFFGPVMAKRLNLYIRRVIAAGTGIVGIPTDLDTRCRLCFVMLKIMAERFDRFRRSRDVFLAAKHDLSGVGPQPFRFAFRRRRYDVRDRAAGCCCSLLVTAAAGTSKRCRCRRITFPRPFRLAVCMAKRLAVLKALIPGFAADRAALVVGCLCGTRCRRDKILFLRILHINVLREFSIFHAANFAFSGVSTRCLAAAMVCLVVDLVAAATFVPM